MICACGNVISIARTTVNPAVTDCIDCASQNDVVRTVGVMVWDHKTAPYCEVGTKLAVESAGKKHRYGPHIRMGSKSGSTISPFVAPQRGAAAATESDEVEPLFLPSRCHPLRPRIGPSGFCLDCALTLQKLRVRQ